jgi:protein-disulfide isomerase
MKKFYLIFAAVAVVGIGAVGYSVGSGTLAATASEPVAIEGADDMARLVEMAQGVTLGDANAPVTIVEFGDYQCPACGQFALSVKPQIDLSYVDQGRAKFVFYDFPLVSIHPNAFIGARAARCAGDQDRYWEYHDQLFQNQSRWSTQANPVGTLVDYAGPAGLDAGEFEACLKSDRHAELVSANMQLGAQLGVSGTPTLMVNAGGQTRRLNSNSFQAIQGVIESLTSGSGESGGN